MNNESNTVVASDLEFVLSSVAEVKGQVNGLYSALNTSVTEDYGETDTKIPSYEDDLTSAGFKLLNVLCEKFEKDLTNLLLVGRGIAQMDSDLGNYADTLPVEQFSVINTNNDVEVVDVNNTRKNPDNIYEQVHHAKEVMNKVDSDLEKARKGGR